MLAAHAGAPQGGLSTLSGVASRKEEKERLRRERLERERAAAAAAARRRRIAVVAGAIAAVAAIGAVIAVAAGRVDGGGSDREAAEVFPDVDVPARKVEDLEDAAKAAGCELSSPMQEGTDHVETRVKYESNPPTSGPMSGSVASDGVAEKDVALEQVVHSLEHGRVAFWFDADTPAPARGALKAVFDEQPPALILARNPKRMPEQVAATAWGEKLACPRYNDRVPDALRAFRDEFRYKGPEFMPGPQ